jgi:hypothetical protein
MLRLFEAKQMIRFTLTFAALVVFLGCGAPKKLAVTNLTVANQDGGAQDVTKDDATINFNALEAFELSLIATGSGFPAGQSICEIQIFKQGGKEEATAKTRCNLERDGNQIKVYQRLLTPEQPMEGELRISHDGQRILTRRVTVVKK